MLIVVNHKIMPLDPALSSSTSSHNSLAPPPPNVTMTLCFHSRTNQTLQIESCFLEVARLYSPEVLVVFPSLSATESIQL
jgi:hypothetical protein